MCLLGSRWQLRLKSASLGWTFAAVRHTSPQSDGAGHGDPSLRGPAETFDFLDDWEDRYRHVIDLGKAMPPLDDSFKVPALKVQGCASQVWLRPMVEGGRFDFQGDSDAMIVRGLIAVLHCALLRGAGGRGRADRRHGRTWPTGS